jgi:hypothetical protein
LLHKWWSRKGKTAWANSFRHLPIHDTELPLGVNTKKSQHV